MSQLAPDDCTTSSNTASMVRGGEYRNRSCENGPIEKGLALRAQGSEFNSQHLCKKLGVAVCPCDPSAKEVETGESLELTGQTD